MTYKSSSAIRSRYLVTPFFRPSRVIVLRENRLNQFHGLERRIELASLRLGPRDLVEGIRLERAGFGIDSIASGQGAFEVSGLSLRPGNVRLSPRDVTSLADELGGFECSCTVTEFGLRIGNSLQKEILPSLCFFIRRPNLHRQFDRTFHEPFRLLSVSVFCLRHRQIEQNCGSVRT